MSLRIGLNFNVHRSIPIIARTKTEWEIQLQQFPKEEGKMEATKKIWETT